MKKITLLLCLMYVLACAVFAAEPAGGNAAFEAVPEPAAVTTEIKPAVSAMDDDTIESLQRLFLFGDVALTGWAVFAYFDAKQVMENYDRHYAEADNTTLENYEKLKDEKANAEMKQIIFGAATALAATALAYTALDYFHLHIVFPAEVKAAAVPGGAVISAAYDW